MEIKINNNNADITIDTEKTIGEIMAGLENWLAGSGHRLSGIAIDGQAANLSSMEEIFVKDIDSVKLLEISTSSIAELDAVSLLNLLADIDEYENLSFEERNAFFNNWKERPQALFASEYNDDLYDAFVNTFLNAAFSAQVLRSITEERLREVNEPLKEFENIKQMIEEVCARLVDLPLDIQTGKDARAAQTIQIFSALAQKIIRIIKQFEIQGFFQKESVSVLITGFNEKVKEFLNAYEAQDTVLIGDLAEYEIAPGLQELYKNCHEAMAGIK
uniref:Uncharacterized protein n=1 Tax=uncultured bacterium contig00030 TaxID=1181519 RepID=A0A806KEC9_9BACT|nr:hypothetical protein [uncultured bacterium contig00030]